MYASIISSYFLISRVSKMMELRGDGIECRDICRCRMIYKEDLQLNQYILCQWVKWWVVIFLDVFWYGGEYFLDEMSLFVDSEKVKWCNVTRLNRGIYESKLCLIVVCKMLYVWMNIEPCRNRMAYLVLGVSCVVDWQNECCVWWEYPINRWCNF